MRAQLCARHPNMTHKILAEILSSKCKVNHINLDNPDCKRNFPTIRPSHPTIDILHSFQTKLPYNVTHSSHNSYVVLLTKAIVGFHNVKMIQKIFVLPRSFLVSVARTGFHQSPSQSCQVVH